MRAVRTPCWHLVERNFIPILHHVAKPPAALSALGQSAVFAPDLGGGTERTLKFVLLNVEHRL